MVSVESDASHSYLDFVSEKNIAYAGKPFTLECPANFSSKFWAFQTSQPDKNRYEIAANGRVHEDEIYYFELNQTQSGGFSLIIRNTSLNNTGLYSCGEFNLYVIYLIVLGKCAHGHFVSTCTQTKHCIHDLNHSKH